MDYVTQYYKNLSEQLQQRVDILQNKIQQLNEMRSLGDGGIGGGGGFGGGGRGLGGLIDENIPPWHNIQPIWGAPYGGWGGYGGEYPPSRPTGPGGPQGGNNFPQGYENNPLYLEWLAENPKPNAIYYPQQYQQWLASFWTWYYQTFN